MFGHLRMPAKTTHPVVQVIDRDKQHIWSLGLSCPRLAKRNPKPSATSANRRSQLIQRFFALAADRFFETFFPAPRRHKYPYRKKTCGFSAKPDSQTAAGRSACSGSRPDKSSAAHSSQSSRRASPPHTPWADFSGSPYGSPQSPPADPPAVRQIPVNRSCLACMRFNQGLRASLPWLASWRARRPWESSLWPTKGLR